MMSRVIYDKSLQWMQRPSEFDRDHQAVLLACSEKDKIWTTYHQLYKRSGLEEKILSKSIHELLIVGAIILNQDTKDRSIFALRERLK